MVKLFKFSVVVLVMNLSGWLFAQTAGSISGIVTDPTDAVVSAATIRATNVATGATDDDTNAAGFYSLPTGPGTMTSWWTKDFSPSESVAGSLCGLSRSIRRLRSVRETDHEVNGGETAPIETETANPARWSTAKLRPTCR
jgi:hypothetical protein